MVPAAVGNAPLAELRHVVLQPHQVAALRVHLAQGEAPGENLFGRGKAIRVGRTLAFAEASIEDGGGRLLARAQSRFSVSGREPATD